MEVLINNQQKKIKINTRRIKRLAREIMLFESLPDNSELSIVFCEDDFIQKLNHDYLGQNRPTDVISFPLPEGQVEAEVRLLGDIVINVDSACRQAEKMGHSLELEIVFLLVHGLLHLCGYDHDNTKRLKTMREREEQIVTYLCNRKMLQGDDGTGAGSLIRRAVPTTPKAAKRPRPS